PGSKFPMAHFNTEEENWLTRLIHSLSSPAKSTINPKMVGSNLINAPSVPLTISPNQYQRIASQFPGATIPYNSSSAKHGDVYLDGEKVGHVITRNMANSINRGGTISGSTGSNASVSPTPSGMNYYGGYN